MQLLVIEFVLLNDILPLYFERRLQTMLKFFFSDPVVTLFTPLCEEDIPVTRLYVPVNIRLFVPWQYSITQSQDTYHPVYKHVRPQLKLHGQ